MLMGTDGFTMGIAVDEQGHFHRGGGTGGGFHCGRSGRGNTSER